MTTNNIPKPVGWRVLIKVKPVQDQTSGGVYLAPISQDTARVAAMIGQVVELGGDAYGDVGRFNREWCEVDDWVMIGKYAGVKFEIDKEEYRMINDDEVIAVVTDPDAIKYYGA